MKWFYVVALVLYLLDLWKVFTVKKNNTAFSAGTVWGAWRKDSCDVRLWLRSIFQTRRDWRSEDSHEHHRPGTAHRGVERSGQRWSRGGTVKSPLKKYLGSVLMRIVAQMLNRGKKNLWDLSGNHHRYNSVGKLWGADVNPIPKP